VRLELSQSRFRSRKGLLLNDDGLRHVVRSAGLTGNLVSNEGFRLAVA
jgi:hypothetical protein